MDMSNPVMTHTGVMFMEKPKTSIRPIKVTEWIDKVGPLLDEHYQEVALNKDLMRLEPDLIAYAELERADRLIALGAFSGEQMVGYSVSILGQALHYASLRTAHNDVVFVSKEHRFGSLGIGLIQRTEAAAKDRGVQMLLWHAKQGTPLEGLLPRMGYGVQDVIFSKGL
ncbi:hypothetical protein [Hydrogenophaga sp. BPS33]|uniref:hypothetical protein n=1 Tax=Hydrogenophaga sp. BPS33 TaxID=2651974 RepID=UPI00131FAC29|nr:hypothetical protein [Hydrogenophaga sp. BPS33]QHE86314.1 hypothetical protein F9K07_16085 [Hydrogenophaga sp. BPS33]